MTEVQHVTEVAKGISDYGMMAVSAAFFLLLSAAMMIALFKWFKSMNKPPSGTTGVFESIA